MQVDVPGRADAFSAPGWGAWLGGKGGRGQATDPPPKIVGLTLRMRKAEGLPRHLKEQAFDCSKNSCGCCSDPGRGTGRSRGPQEDLLPLPGAPPGDSMGGTPPPSGHTSPPRPPAGLTPPVHLGWRPHRCTGHACEARVAAAGPWLLNCSHISAEGAGTRQWPCTPRCAHPWDGRSQAPPASSPSPGSPGGGLFLIHTRLCTRGWPGPRPSGGRGNVPAPSPGLTPLCLPCCASAFLQGGAPQASLPVPRED